MVKDNLVRDRLGKLYAHKSMGPDGMQIQELRKLAKVIAELLSIFLESSWRIGEVPEDWKKPDVIPSSKVTRRIQETTGQSASPLSLERGLNNLLWMSLPSKWRRRRLSGAINMGSPRRNHTGPGW